MTKRFRKDDDDDNQDARIRTVSRKAAHSRELITSEGGRDSDSDEFDDVSDDDNDLSIDEEGGMMDDEASKPKQNISSRKGLFLSQRDSGTQHHNPTDPKKNENAPNRQRVLMLSSRGITTRHRHLMNDLHALMPHCKKESKLDTKSKLYILNELSELANCNNCLFFESRKHQDLYMWLSKTPNGPSAKFLVQNIQTMDELKLTGNALKGSRPILSFDAAFDSKPEYVLIREMLLQIFGTPRTSRKIKPFFDHVMSFTILDNRIWFRNHQIVEKLDEKDTMQKTTLVEIGPRFCLSLIKIFDNSFSGAGVFESATFVSPNQIRRLAKLETSSAYVSRVADNAKKDVKMAGAVLEEDPLNKVFEDVDTEE
ncbi:hypothetical protein SeMB42_g02428 [Synchytrium endobioticum]|uniref:Brix domain-containing protein n=1 Tax=Synchytrium endobioticum TaxID=286115 RepID=A0A507D1P4_9FUNG|nr:hypothetical protein SeLEV6574_g03868 [Synchytrium endobioticum]TPX49942.1 hypothetical protein SeMB42_g02428 [Synchytrium endobioticum]